MNEIRFLTNWTSDTASLPYADLGVRAGFPSPAQDFIDKRIDLNEQLIAHPAASFIAKIAGTSMVDDGFNEGDLVVIDKSIEPKHGNVVVAFINGEFTIKRLDLSEWKTKGIVWLRPANKEFAPIKISAGEDFRIWGVVTRLIKNVL